MTEDKSTEVVTLQSCGNVLVVTVDNPPVNALGVDVRHGLMNAIDAAERDAAVAVVLMVGAGRTFIAGADIREFGKPPQPPSLPDVCNRIESCSKPVVAASTEARSAAGSRSRCRRTTAWRWRIGQARTARSHAGAASRRGRHATRTAPDRRQVPRSN